MNVLLDTHAFLWFIGGSDQLSQRARELIEDPGNQKSLSAASLWEMGIKMSLGRLTLAQPFEDFIPKQMEQNGFALLPVGLSHVSKLITLPFHHRDPFDRLLVAQCVAEGLALISADPVFDEYGVRRLW